MKCAPPSLSSLKFQPPSPPPDMLNTDHKSLKIFDWDPSLHDDRSRREKMSEVLERHSEDLDYTQVLNMFHRAKKTCPNFKKYKKTYEGELMSYLRFVVKYVLFHVLCGGFKCMVSETNKSLQIAHKKTCATNYPMLKNTHDKNGGFHVKFIRGMGEVYVLTTSIHRLFDGRSPIVGGNKLPQTESTIKWLRAMFLELSRMNKINDHKDFVKYIRKNTQLVGENVVSFCEEFYDLSD